jgi:hypothetical protein
VVLFIYGSLLFGRDKERRMAAKELQMLWEGGEAGDRSQVKGGRGARSDQICVKKLLVKALCGKNPKRSETNLVKSWEISFAI